MGYTLTLKRNNNNDPIIHANAVDAAKIDINIFGWYNQNYTPSMENQQLVMEQILDKSPTELFTLSEVSLEKMVILRIIGRLN